MVIRRVGRRDNWTRFPEILISPMILQLCNNSWHLYFKACPASFFLPRKKYLYPKNTMSHVKAARTYLDISDNDSFPSLFLSNKSSWKKSKLHVGTINHVKMEICTVMTNLISMMHKLEELSSYVQTDAATPNNVASVWTGLKVCVTTSNNTQQYTTWGVQTYATCNFQQIITYR